MCAWVCEVGFKAKYNETRFLHTMVVKQQYFEAFYTK